VAYLSGNDLRVVAGDGTGDHLLAARVARVAPAWRPGHPYQLAYLTANGGLVVRDGDTGARLWSAKPGRAVRQLAWSADGERLLALSPQRVLIYAGDGRLLAARSASGDVPIVDGALSPDGRTLALLAGGGGSAVVVYGVAARHPVTRRVLAGAGLRQVAWSPDGRWVLISWPAANQWVFVRVVGPPRIAAVSRIAQQFSAGASARFPRLEGWCCNAAGAAG
jgi:Tol biopolymer transport system component